MRERDPSGWVGTKVGGVGGGVVDVVLQEKDTECAPGGVELSGGRGWPEACLHPVEERRGLRCGVGRNIHVYHHDGVRGPVQPLPGGDSGL